MKFFFQLFKPLLKCLGVWTSVWKSEATDLAHCRVGGHSTDNRKCGSCGRSWRSLARYHPAWNRKKNKPNSFSFCGGSVVSGEKRTSQSRWMLLFGRLVNKSWTSPIHHILRYFSDWTRAATNKSSAFLLKIYIFLRNEKFFAAQRM